MHKTVSFSPVKPGVEEVKQDKTTGKNFLLTLTRIFILHKSVSRFDPQPYFWPRIKMPKLSDVLFHKNAFVQFGSAAAVRRPSRAEKRDQPR